MNRRKKQIYGAILALGGLALLLDRIAFQTTAPSAAQASMSPSAGSTGVEAPKGPVVSVAVTPFPSDLPPVSSEHELRDVFATTDTIRAEMLLLATEDARGNGTRRTTKERTAAESFQRSRRLTAVMLGERLSFAIVDESWLQVGDRMDDCELTGMTGTTATFDCPGGDVTLSVTAAETDDSGGR